MADLERFSRNADPVVRNLIPDAQKLKPTLQAVNQLSPYLRTLFVKLGPLVTISRTGLPATEPVATFPVEIRDGDIYVSTTPSNGVNP